MHICISAWYLYDQTGHKMRLYCKCGWLVEQTHFDPILYVSPDNPAHSVELVRCRDDSILTVEAFVQINNRGRRVSDECDTTPTFAEFCEATVRCRFTQAEFRTAVRDVCDEAYDEARITFLYNCLSGILFTSHLPRQRQLRASQCRSGPVIYCSAK